MEDAGEIQEALGRSYGTPEIDEDDLEAGKWVSQRFLTMFQQHSDPTGSQLSGQIPNNPHKKVGNTSGLYSKQHTTPWLRQCVFLNGSAVVIVVSPYDARETGGKLSAERLENNSR